MLSDKEITFRLCECGIVNATLGNDATGLREEGLKALKAGHTVVVYRTQRPSDNFVCVRSYDAPIHTVLQDIGRLIQRLNQYLPKQNQ
jgi:hypothetical protein